MILLRSPWVTVALMQRLLVPVSGRYVDRVRERRARNRQGRYRERPGPTPLPAIYGLRMRNTPGSGWAKFARAAREGIRDQRGRPLTQSELARRTGIDRTTLWRWEQGQQR